MSYLIICDIDHTLLNDAGRLLPDNVAALAEAQAQGATVVLATARSYIGAMPIHRALGLSTPLIVSNGTLIQNPDGRVLHTENIDSATAKDTFCLFAKTPHHWSVRLGATAYLHPAFDTSRAPFDNKRYYRPINGPYHALFGDFTGVASLSLFGEDVAPFYAAHNWQTLGLAPSFYMPSAYDPREAMSLISERTSKGEAARWLRHYLGLNHAPVLALGDSPADATMFPLGIGVAPANAPLEVRAAASWVGPHCNDGVVAAAVQRFVLEAVAVGF